MELLMQIVKIPRELEAVESFYKPAPPTGKRNVGIPSHNSVRGIVSLAFGLSKLRCRSPTGPQVFRALKVHLKFRS